jgi:hypothetical protein
MFHGEQCSSCVGICLCFVTSDRQLSAQLAVCSHLTSSMQCGTSWCCILQSQRIIKKCTWPARSPDRNPCDYFFWSCLKDQVYNNNSRKEELKENIRRENANIPAEQLRRVNLHLFRRCEDCLCIKGQHFQRLL